MEGLQVPGSQGSLEVWSSEESAETQEGELQGLFLSPWRWGSGLALGTPELIGEPGRAEETGTGLLPVAQGFPELKVPDLSPPTLNSGLELLPSRGGAHQKT